MDDSIRPQVSLLQKDPVNVFVVVAVTGLDSSRLSINVHANLFGAVALCANGVNVFVSCIPVDKMVRVRNKAGQVFGGGLSHENMDSDVFAHRDGLNGPYSLENDEQ